MNDLNNDQYGIVSKLEVSDLAVGNFPTTYLDKTGLFTWSKVSGATATSVNVVESNGIKFIKFQPTYAKLINSDFITKVMPTNLSLNSFQFETDIIIPNIAARNIFFNVSSGSINNTGFHFEITNAFVGGIKLNISQFSILFNYEFKSNVKYNIVVTKNESTFSVMIDGLVVGKLSSSVFNGYLVSAVPSPSNITIGAQSAANGSQTGDLVGLMTNIQISVGKDYLKYKNSFTKYGDNLLSRYNFDNLASTTSGNNFAPDSVEAVTNGAFTWTLTNPSFAYSAGWVRGNKTSFTSSIPNEFRIQFDMRNTTRHIDVEMMNLNNKYKLIYNYIAETLPEPTVVVNSNTKSALDFENGILDKISETTWTTSGTANVTNQNKIFGTATFETKDIDGAINTTSNLITGGLTPYTIEFYSLIKDAVVGSSVTDKQYPLYSKSNDSGAGDQYFAVATANEGNKIYYARDVNAGGRINNVFNNYGNQNIRFNEINKYTVSYDGAAMRFFVNDKLDMTLGTTNGFFPTASLPFKFMNQHIPSWQQYRLTTLGLLDNVNIFDGVANIVRTKDEYDDYLVVDISGDGENDSTKIVDNGTAKLVWNNASNTLFKTTHPLSGFSSLKFNSTNYLTLLTGTSDLDFASGDFTVSMELCINEDLSAVGSKMILYSNEPGNGSTAIAIAYNGGAYTFNGDGKDHKYRLCMYDNTGMLLFIQTKTLITNNVVYKLRITRKNGILNLYLNDVLEDTLYYTGSINFNLSENRFIGTNRDRSMFAQMNLRDLKIYKGVAVIPASTTGRTKLEFNNNLNDTYKNSTSTSTSITYDQSNSIKGYSAKFNTTNDYVEIAESSATKIGDNNFSMKYDSNIISFPTNGEMISNNFAPNASNNNNYMYVPCNNSQGGVRGFGINTGNTYPSTVQGMNVNANVWYNDHIVKKDKCVTLKRNDVIFSSINIDDTMVHNISGLMRIGKPTSTFGDVYPGLNGYVDDFEIHNDVSTKDSIIYQVGTNGGLPAFNNSNDILSCTWPNGGTGTYPPRRFEYVLPMCPSVSNFDVVADILITSTHDAIFRLNTNTSDFSTAVEDNMGYSFTCYKDAISFARGGNGPTSSWTVISTITTPTILLDNKFHKFRVVKNDNNFKVYVDNVLYLDANDSTYQNVSSKIGFGLNNYISGIPTPRQTYVKSIRVSNVNGNELYYKDWKSELNVVVDKPAIHFPFENNFTNIGYCALDTVTFNGTPQYPTIGGRKCIRMDDASRLMFTGHNNFKFHNTTDFVIETDFFVVDESRYHILLANNSPQASDNLFTITVGPNLEGNTMRSKVYMYLKGYTIDGLNIKTDNDINWNNWNNIKVIKKGHFLKMVLNGVESAPYYHPYLIDFAYNGFTRIGNSNYTSTANLIGYVSNFKLFVGTSEIPSTYNDKAVIDIDFSPTRKSYLFKDNLNKVMLHPSNITKRDYINSRYACTFDGVNQSISLGKNKLFDFGIDDFVIRIDYEWSGTSPNLYNTIIGSNYPNATMMDFIMILQNGNLNIRATNVEIVKDSDGIKSVNGTNKLILQRVGNVLNVMLNNNPYSFPITGTQYFDLNRNDNTHIGRNTWDGGSTGFFKGSIYLIRMYRNTSDLSLLDDPILSFSEKFTLTNGIDVVDAEFVEIRDHNVKLISDTDKITAVIDDQVIEVSKDSSVDHVVLHNNYTGNLKELRVYDTAFYDEDTYEGSQLISYQLPELDLFEDEEFQELQIYDVGNYHLKGFVEGYHDRPFVMYSNASDQVLYEGNVDYDLNYLDENFLDEYEIRDLTSGQKYPPVRHEMVKGYISGTVNLKKCGVSAPQMKVYCYRSDTFRLIGIYSVDQDGKYNIPNLDVNSRYDIIFRDEQRSIKDQLSNYRKPVKY